MDTKLTLKLDKSVIEKAKAYAKGKNQSLSELVENFFKGITTKESKEVENYAPLVKELSGILKPRKKMDVKKEYTDYLIEKYK